ncbi:MAG: hypothetical protein HQL83_15795 [Magnetococcales bacterium]|nr:hypothetical protein [Magnetococcales bacterium]
MSDTVPPFPRAPSPPIRRRIQRFSLDAAHSFLARRRHPPLSAAPAPREHTDPAADPPQPAPPEVTGKTHDALTVSAPSTLREVDQYWGRLLNALETGRISPGEGRQLAKNLGRLRQILEKKPSKTS